MQTKRTHARPSSQVIARQRALIRSLIEQTICGDEGDSGNSAIAETHSHALRLLGGVPTQATAAGGEIIPFPKLANRSQKGMRRPD